ncbi:ATP-binding protein [Caldimonas thermodepolymerans]|uniref:ATP-binding protein n=1 Tax=Caldimonas thermodepolymerans TaxID=215580 RepID=UPI0022355B60|nr:ATP-binding protein [Caldimonas thermodepolymerans]UZG44306.1 ATP-binding protein [Caldimonas thermodepolymerans]
MLTPNDVFTPGKLPIRPTNVYAARGEAETQFRKALQRGMIPVVYGEYGVGKTSMARFVLRDADEAGRLVNVESVADKSLDEVFSRCLEKLGYAVTTKRVEGAVAARTHEQSGQAEANSGWLKAIVASKRSQTVSTTQQVEEQFVVTSPTDSKLIELCEAAGVVLLLDELHRATTDFASDLSKFLKSYGNASCSKFKVVLLGTSSDASRLVSSDPGIDRLLQEVHLKAMTSSEAEFVVVKGMGDLAIKIEPSTVDRLVRTCVGSPSILQYLALETAEAAFSRDPRVVQAPDVEGALQAFVETKEARLNKSYVAAIESVGELRYRKQILRAMAECEDEYVTMEMIRTRVSEYLGKDIPSTALSGPLRDLKDERFGTVLSDVERPDGSGRLANYTTFKDPALKAFIRLQILRESEGAA